jgi:tRNA(Ile)-lysidine synthase
MHLLRGSGLAGLRGMVYRSLPNPWSDRIPLVRPLLNIWRQQIQDYLKDQNIESFEDSTNFDTRYTRNQLRLEILPILEDKYPGFCQRLWQMAILVGDDLEIINSQVDKAWEKCFLARNSFSISFDLASLRNEPPSLQRYILRRAEHSLQPEITDLGFEAIDRGLNFIKKPSRSQQCEWIGGLWLSIQHGVFIISYSDMDDSESILSEWPQLATSQTISLPIPGKIRLAGNWELSASYQSVEERVLENIYINRDPYSAWVTIESKPERLQVRQRQPGDRLKPLGMSGQSIKVSDLMINQKIPSKARKRWPLVISEQDIIWIPGLRLNENYRLADSDRLAIFLQLRKISNEGQENTV